MTYAIYLSGPSGVLEVVVEAGDGKVGGFQGPSASIVQVGDSYFSRDKVIGIVPSNQLKSRTNWGTPGK